MTSIRNPQQQLRSRAEARLEGWTKSDGEISTADGRELLHELQVHQIELQMQNDALHDAQLVLEDAREKYRRLYDHTPIACLSMGPDTRISEANRACGELLAVACDQLLGRQLSQLVAPEHVEVFARFRRELYTSSKRQSCTLELIGPGSRRKDVRLEGIQAESEPTPQCLLAIIDLTELNQLQRRSQHAHKLETLGTLSSGVAHDVNNLLTAVLSCVDMALARLGAEDAARAPIQQAKEVVARGRTVVDRILHFSRPDQVELASVRLDAAVDAAAHLLGRLLGADVHLELDLRAGEARIQINRGQLDQILFNLVTNAGHAMPAGGRVRIETRVIAPNALHSPVGSEPLPQACVLLTLSDTGLGMDDETRARAFEPFFTTKHPSNGTGLGLSITSDVMADVGGRIELQSAPGHGTTVLLYWPLAEHEAGLATPLPPRPANAPRAGHAVLLLVDDDRLVRAGLHRFLQHAGWEVVEAAGADTALELLRQEKGRFELLVVDALLPGGMGSNLARAAQHLQPRLGVIFVSGHARQELLDRAWLAPDAVVLNKPFTAAELQLAVQQVLAGSGTRSDAPKARTLPEEG